jgi:chromosome segregation ATPase
MKMALGSGDSGVLQFWNRCILERKRVRFEVGAMSESEAAVETESEEQQQTGHEETGALAVSVDDFSALEDRVRRAVDVVKRERQARVAVEARVSELESRVTEAEARATQAETQVKAQSPLVERLESEMSALRAERDQVRQRVERLLAQLDALEL